MYPKISDISSKNLKIIWKTLNLLCLFTFLVFPGFITSSPALHKSGIIWYNYMAGFILFIASNVFHYYSYKKDKALFPKDTTVRAPLPVINNRMKIAWILLNLSGLALILVAIIAQFSSLITVIFVLLGGLCMGASVIFKRRAYKQDKYNNQGSVS